MRMLGFSCLGLSEFLAACSSNVSVFEEGGGGQGGSPQTTAGPGQTNGPGQTSGPSTGTSGPGPSTGTSGPGPSTGTSGPGPSSGTTGPGPTGQVVSASASTGMTCENNFDCETCIECSISTECVSEYDACINDMECGAFNQCIQDCFDNNPNPDPCTQECVETYPGGYQLYLEAVTCIYCGSCYVSCDGQSIGC